MTVVLNYNQSCDRAPDRSVTAYNFIDTLTRTEANPIKSFVFLSRQKT